MQMFGQWVDVMVCGSVWCGVLVWKLHVCGLTGSGSVWWYKLAYEEVRANVYKC